MSWKDAWEHELRGPDGKWLKSGGINTTVLAARMRARGYGPESIRAKLASGKARQWEFIGPHGSKAGAAFLPGNAEPQLGDMARDGHGAVGRVISKGGGHVVLDADDGNRYLVDWRNGGNVVKQLPLGGAKWADPRAPLTGAKPSENIASQLSGVPPSPPGTYTAPGQKQLYLPGTGKMAGEFGSESKVVRQLRGKWDMALKAMEDGNADWPGQGIQGSTAIVTLPGSRGKVIVKRNLNEKLADREELAGYVAQAIGMERPPVVARAGPNDLIEKYVPGVTAERFINKRYSEGDGTDWAYELANTPEGHNIGILDTLVSNLDRHSGNWMVTRDRHPVAIDMSLSKFDGEDYYSPFRGNEEFEDPERLAEIRKNLEKIEPEFTRMGRHAWWQHMMKRMAQLEENAQGNADTDEEDFSNISSQIELSWKDAWLHEKRDAHGRWTRGAAPVSYRMPKPARLHNPRSRDYKDPGDHPFFQAHPVSAANVMQRFDEASDDERAQGMNWYNDAHDLARALGSGDVTKAAGVMAAYSPQTAWNVNMLNAARALSLGRAIGPGEGMITRTMQHNAQLAIDGAPLDKVLRSPKTNAFGHLIAAGGDEPDDPYGKVVIDRHAMSVAVGHRLSKKDVEFSPIGKDRFYEHVADAYREAALRLSEREGVTISPHQLQAITWLRQQDLNEGDDQAAGAADPRLNRLQRGRETGRRNAWARWSAWDWEHGVPSQIGTTSLPGNAIAPEVQHSPAGFSVSMGSGKAPKTGFMVAQNDHTHTFPASVMDSERELADAIDQMLLSESATFSHEDVYLGGWVHDGKLWLEPSDNVVSADEAMALAASRNQIAIWDVAHGNEVQTGGSGGGTIYEHADAQGDHGRTGGLREPARGRAQGGGAGNRTPDPAGIAAQLGYVDLSRKDAWRHEARAPDGKWVHGAAAPAEAGTLAARTGQASKAVHDFTAKLAPAVPGIYGGGFEAWNGKIEIFPDDDKPGVAAEMDWDGHMNVAESVASSLQKDLSSDGPVGDPGAFAVILHELTHGLIGGEADRVQRSRREHGIEGKYAPRYHFGAAEYQDPKNAAIEEGFTELGTVHHAPEFLDAAGIGDRPTAILSGNFSDDFNEETGDYTPRHATVSEYARQLQDPTRIDNGESWGHYGWQTAAAQEWVFGIARDEGHGTVAPGTPGGHRVRELGDEVNRVGTDQKVRVMARQVVRAAGLDPDSGDSIGSDDWFKLEDQIRSQWQRSSDSPGRTSYNKARKFVAARAARLAAEQGGSSR